MRVPSQLRELLQKNNRLNGTIHYVLSIAEPWFEDNKLVFFPEYTDHGPRHIQDVFDSTEALIIKGAWRILCPEDVATLILGIILHDCAMHLSEDGFITLINDDLRPRNEAFHDKPWRKLWNEFMTEARRFDERKLKALFDDEEPVREPILDPLEMTRKDRLLIGEFLRRYHPRLAHEIALTGVPGPQDKGLALGQIPEHIKELGGIVARSHGLNLRHCVDVLNKKNKWGARRTTGIHVTYLMALVRIADYLQIQSERAPQEILQVRSLKSPVSRGEWDAHSAIKDIHQETDDPEALWVEAMPENVKTYLKLKRLLTDIQRELDDSWAVLGEVYGPKEELRGLGLSIRRIKSSLDDSVAFSKTVNYVPCQASLETAGADLLKLLIAPLYGDSPEIGIRELLQNAVDACRELKDYLKQHPHFDKPELHYQAADVIITLEQREDGKKWVNVCDQGIGMTLDTILNYFLKAGASFRNSNVWRKQHEDEHGNVRVIRSGRFGIGVLAGFLLGDEINVSTRHITEIAGVSFSCRLDNEAIQINRISRPIGTTIQVQISNSVYLGLSQTQSWSNSGEEYKWDWFCLKEPSVQRQRKNKILKQQYKLPNANSQLPAEWRRVEHQDYQDIHWSYLAHAPALTCNGIVIMTQAPSSFSGSNYAYSLIGSDFVTPKISVFDSYGKFPLDLQRTSLSVTQLPFEKVMRKDIYLDLLAFMIVFAPVQFSMVRDSHEGHAFYYPGFSQRATWFWYARDGVSLLDSWHLEQLNPSSLIYIPFESGPQLFEAINKDTFHPIVPIFRSEPLKYLLEHTDDVRSEGRRLLIDRDSFERFKKEAKREWEYDYDDFDSWNYYEYVYEERPFREYQKEWESEHWILLKQGHCPDSDVIERIKLQSIHEVGGLAINYPYLSNEQNQFSAIAQLWQDIIGIPYIPYDLQKRRKQLSSAYTRLLPYIQAWENIKKGKNNRKRARRARIRKK